MYPDVVYSEEFDPWVLWQSDERVIHKLSNYAYGSFDLHLRLMVNSTPFHYGKMMVVYIPYGSDNEVAQQVLDTIYSTSSDVRFRAAVQYFSTYQHAFLTAGDNNEVEMVLPFIYHNNYFPLNGLGAVNRFSCGKIFMLSLNNLTRANSTASGAVNLKAYCWASNIKINTPTEFVPQSGIEDVSEDFFRPTAKVSPVENEADEQGIVSAPATAVAEAAGSLSKVPVIGPYATAAEIAAKGVSSIARLFGFSAPLSLERGNFILERSWGPLSSTIGADTCVPLTLDPNQGITVDPGTLGIKPVDEMTISSIVTREQWICKSRWTKNTGVFTNATDTLFMSVVTP